MAAVFINLSVENFAGWKFALTFAIIQKSYFAGFIVYLVINLVLVFSSAYIITQFAPAAAGSGIPEIKGYLNGNINSPFCRFFVCFGLGGEFCSSHLMFYVLDCAGIDIPGTLLFRTLIGKVRYFCVFS